MSALKMLQAWSIACCLASTLGLISLFVLPVTQVSGSHEKSTCRACHTWEDPVVEQGEWHTIHALRISCDICHGGNDEASDRAAAHTGMLSNPLNEPQLSCQHCHPADYQQRTAGVAVALGLAPSVHASTDQPPAAAAMPSTITPWPQITLKSWDWPVELAIAIVLVGLGVMRWRRIHSS